VLGTVLGDVLRALLWVELGPPLGDELRLLLVGALEIAMGDALGTVHRERY
jgi:hypothetical protein